ncbi:HAD-IC family P-type ATPase [Spiroplasma endosymbiont of Apeira syringaria]|uniref:HAD-IC family P-type ATPase n=1 Tax=Spiroplasma endosymbiont of Apeira syringaria TaxID=3066307 RepID=UPI003BB205D8
MCDKIKIVHKGRKAIFILEDELQTNALLTIEKVKKQGIEVILISGDNESQTLAIANRVGIETSFANVTPQGKSQIVADLQAKCKKVAFVGDGINDVIALEQSDLAIAMALSDITVVGNSLIFKWRKYKY